MLVWISVLYYHHCLIIRSFFLDSLGWWHRRTFPSRFNIILQRIQLSGFVFTSSAFVLMDILRGKGKKKTSLWWLPYGKSLSVLPPYPCLKHLWSNEFSWGLFRKKNLLNLSENLESREGREKKSFAMELGIKSAILSIKRPLSPDLWIFNSSF